MRDKTFIRYSIPYILKAINSTYDDISTVRYENTLSCIFGIPLMMLAAALNFVGRYLMLHHGLQSVLIDSGVFILIGILFELAMRTNIPVILAKHLISLLYCLTFVFIVFRFYPLIGSTVWTIGYTMAILAMIRTSKAMLMYFTITILLSGVMVSAFPSYFHFKIDTVYYVVQFCFFTMLFSITIIVQRINSLRQRRVILQLKEVNKQIEERIKAEEKTAHLAMYDHLTDLPNRTLFYDRLNQSILLADRNSEELYVLFLDIDFFKIINDTLGHTQGDEVIKQVANRLAKLFRKSDTVARIGGDEFMILLQNIKQPIDQIALNILQEIRKPLKLTQQNLSVTCSIGIAKFPSDGEDSETLIKHADMAMYKAKAEGKNGFAYFSDNLRVIANMELELISSLHQALKRNELQLYYQPQVDCSTGNLIGIEALARWNHPKIGLIKPIDFISLAERTGLIVPLGEWVLRAACKQNKLWQKEGLFQIPVSVNISVRQLENNNLAEQISKILAETGLEPHYLDLEFTEGAVVRELDKIKSQLYALRKLGIGISIDDFGKGYSSIHYLSELPVKKIKIPMDFVKGISKNMKDESIISVIIALAENLHLGIVAEGVETKSQLEFLEKRLCKNMQGYYFSKPVPADEVKGYMEECLRKKIS